MLRLELSESVKKNQMNMFYPKFNKIAIKAKRYGIMWLVDQHIHSNAESVRLKIKVVK